MEIYTVNTKHDLRKFINFPYTLHASQPNWIPPLKLEQKDIFNLSKNSILQSCDYQLFLVRDNSNVIGRTVVYINHSANKYWNAKIGFFGHYECIDNQEAACALLNAATNWLRDRGMTTMRGPYNFLIQDLGFTYEGFDVPPVVMSPFNPPYFNNQMICYGMQKAKDLHVYSCDTGKGYKIPERFIKFTDRIERRFNVKVRAIDVKNLVAEIKTIVILRNASNVNYWSYYPMNVEEAEEIASKWQKLIHPEVVLIAEIHGKAIGYLIVLPDINSLLKHMKGRLFPFGIFKLKHGIKKLRRYRIWAMGLLPPYQKKGISALMFRRLNEVLSPRNFYLEANFILEDNSLMNNTLIQLGFTLVKKYRVYETNLY